MNEQKEDCQTSGKNTPADVEKEKSDEEEADTIEALVAAAAAALEQENGEDGESHSQQVEGDVETNGSVVADVGQENGDGGRGGHDANVAGAVDSDQVGGEEDGSPPDDAAVADDSDQVEGEGDGSPPDDAVAADDSNQVEGEGDGSPPDDAAAADDSDQVEGEGDGSPPDDAAAVRVEGSGDLLQRATDVVGQPLPGPSTRQREGSVDVSALVDSRPWQKFV